MLPHIKNSKAGNNRQEPIWKSIFEVYFTIPTALQAKYGNDVAVLTEQVQSISGLDSVTKGPEVATQKFMGSTRTYLVPKLDDTSHEIGVKVALNQRNNTDNYIFKLFQAWNRLGYDLTTGTTTVKGDYVADWMKIVVGNRAGDIYRELIFKDIMLFGGLTGLDELDYSSNDIVELEMKFKSDWCDPADA